MQDKVWQIKDPTEKTQVIKRGQRPGTKSIRRKKDPAKAVSLSLLFWGGGQIYNDQVGRGVVFLLIMTAVYAGIAIFAFSWDTIVSAMDYESLPIDYIGIIFGVVFLFSIMLWAFNANQAYHKAVKINREPYGGTGNKVLPFVCSLVIPGWGQFLNGQDKKGSVFLGLHSVSLLSVGSILSILFLWNSLEVERFRIFFELILAIALLYVPFIPLVNIISGFDALKVSMDEVKKESFIKRLKYANNRRKIYGWKGILPNLRVTMVLILLLVMLLAGVYYYSPQKYYISQLKEINERMSERKMVIIPYMMDRVLGQEEGSNPD